MKLTEILFQEFDHEMPMTRKTLERVPDDKFGWKPHDKSMSMGRLAIHLAELPYCGAETIRAASMDIAPVGAPPYQPPDLKSTAAVLELFDKNVALARAALSGLKTAQLSEPWSLLSGGNEIFSMPRVVVLRNFLLNHNVHHRAQMGVYLRLNGVAVPSIYGPSADESTT